MVTGAAALLNVWFLDFNDTSEAHESSSDPIGEDWEEAFIKIIVGEDQPEGLPPGTELFALAQKRLDKVVS
jgi:hypothetical protein